MSFLEYLSRTRLILWVAESDWGYPIVLTLHAIGMALVVGVVMLFDLRVLGLAPQLPLRAFRSFSRVAWIGLVTNLASGSLLFCANYLAFLTNVAFITKISLLIAAAIATLMLVRTLKGAGDAPIGANSRMLAGLCFVLLLAAITAGRIIGYTSVPE